MLIWCYFVQPRQQQGIFSYPLNRNLKFHERETNYYGDNKYFNASKLLDNTQYISLVLFIKVQDINVKMLSCYHIHLTIQTLLW